MVATEHAVFYRPHSRKQCTSVVSIQSGAHLVCMKVVFTKHPLTVLQADLPKRAEPTELKAIFETYLQYIYCVLCASFWRSFSLIFQFMFISLYQNSIAQHAPLWLLSVLFTACQHQEEWWVLPVTTGSTLWGASSMPTQICGHQMRPQSCWLEWWTRSMVRFPNISLVVLGDLMFHIN